jgi:tRNA dimethylallyltransferase
MDTRSVNNPLIVLLGPTAVGKTGIAVPVAQVLGTDILTADSRQVYRGMDIGMDKPRPAERGGVPHRLIDVIDPAESFNVGQYRRLALVEIGRLHGEGRVAFMVGGTGLYIRAVVRGLWDGPPADWVFRRELMELARTNGPEYLHRRLEEVDPELAGRLHTHDLVKIVRGLEAYHATGRPLSELHRQHGFQERPFSTLLIGLNRDREALYRRIDERVDSQLAQGLLEETRRLLGQGCARDLGSMKGLGYRQLSAYLEGECPYEEAVRRLKRDTRHFAKRQLTWFRKEPNVRWLSLDEHGSPAEAADRVLALIEAFLTGRLGAEPTAVERITRTA